MGDTYATEGHSARTAATSSSVSVDCPEKIRAPDCVDVPGKTMRKFVPREEIWACTAAWAPPPTALIAMKQATPRMILSALSVDRSFWRAISFMPTFRIVRNLSIGAQPLAAVRRFVTG